MRRGVGPGWGCILDLGWEQSGRRTPFYPRRHAKGREEHLFVHEGSLRAAKKDFFPKGTRRTPFYPRRHAKGREEHLFVHEGPLRAAKKDSFPKGTRRTPFYPRRHAKGREEHLFVHEGPLRAAKKGLFPKRMRRTPFFDRRRDAKSQEKGHSAGHPQGHPQGVPLRWDGPVEGNVNGSYVIWRDAVQAPGPGLTVESVSWACEGRHQAGTYRGLTGLAGRGVAGPHFGQAPVTEYRHQVGEACCRRGGVAGAEPPHKGGPNRPDRPELQ